MPPLNRRHFLALIAAASLSPDFPTRAPVVQGLRSVRLGEPFPVPGSHGDTWVATLAEDGHLYSPSNDTYGFGKATDSNIAFNRLDGADPTHLTGTTINPMSD